MTKKYVAICITAANTKHHTPYGVRIWSHTFSSRKAAEEARDFIAHGIFRCCHLNSPHVEGIIIEDDDNE